MSDSGITTLFENIGKTHLIPGYDYLSGDKKAQEDFMKKKQEESGNKKDKAKKEKKGVKLEDAQNKKNRGGCCDKNK